MGGLHSGQCRILWRFFRAMSLGSTLHLQICKSALPLIVPTLITPAKKSSGSILPFRFSTRPRWCYSEELSSTFLKSRVRNRNAWCGSDEGTCSKSACAHGYTHGQWECCSKKYCVDVSSDSFNCGKCGHACGYGLSCCKGKCVDLNTDKSHCGSCHHQKCAFGICGYG